MSVIRFDCKTNQEWRAERAHSIGASSVGILIGENHFTTPMELAQRMRAELGGEFDYTQTLPMMRGHAYEQGVADLFEWQTGHQVIKSSSAEYLLRRDDIPFMHASPDRTYWIDENGTKHGKNAEFNKGILECKTTRRPIDPDDLPLSWIFQLQVQMGISGYRQGFIAWDVLTNPDGFGYQFFEYSEEIFSAAVEVCREFWQNCILGGKDPEPVNARDIIRKYPSHITGKTITASQDTIALLSELKELKATKKELETEIDEMTDKVKAMFTDEEAMIDMDGHVLATYKASAGRKTVDSKKLQSDYPEIYEEVLKQSAGSRTLSIK
ncbi:MAG: YqaJ viral recombinase family protein [Bacteroidales bacterium]|nr:YqaJ viral recombinase family protein [Bacteroidales bacterium]